MLPPVPSQLPRRAHAHTHVSVRPVCILTFYLCYYNDIIIFNIQNNTQTKPCLGYISQFFTIYLKFLLRDKVQNHLDKFLSFYKIFTHN